MITDRIGRHEVLLLISHTLTKFVIYRALFYVKTTEIPTEDFFFPSIEKQKPFKCARAAMARTVQFLRHEYLTVLLRLKQGS